jgi:putative heme-binding domain-containing protein
MGYRNAYDLAFNKSGDLFTYDSDMEWDMSTPWYRPTRVNHVTSGADYGYRNGAGKWPTYYLDSLPPVVNIGPGSPTGVCFGYGSRFPAKFQEALFLCDWSYGKLYAAHLKPEGSTYTADLEEFVTGTPLPLTDVVINPTDGAMYFTIGGRKTTSGLYRVTYTGEPTSFDRIAQADPASEIRKKLEAFHGHSDPKAVEFAWPYLSHPDRFVRYAARVALEFQDPETWRDKALDEANPLAATAALLALVHVSASDPAHRPANAPGPDKALGLRILQALPKLEWASLPYARKLDVLRLVDVLFNRFGPPESDVASQIIDHLDPTYPARGRELNVELCNLLVYLNAPSVARKTMELIEAAPTQEEQIDLARALRTLRTGWTPELRASYFSWINRASDFKGGPSLEGFLKQIKTAAVATLSESEKAELKPILEAPPRPKSNVASTGPARQFVKEWTVEELVPVVESGLKKKRDFEKGRTLFAAANCFACHRFADEGGAVGPDLTALAGRFSPRDLVESIVLPSKVISDQYEAVIIATADGQTITGRIMNLHNDTMTINTNMLDPSAQVNVNRSRIEEMRPSPISMMPDGLLSTLDGEEVVDLIAYLLSRGDRESKLFQ